MNKEFEKNLINIGRRHIALRGYGVGTIIDTEVIKLGGPRYIVNIFNDNDEWFRAEFTLGTLHSYVYYLRNSKNRKIEIEEKRKPYNSIW